MQKAPFLRSRTGVAQRLVSGCVPLLTAGASHIAAAEARSLNFLSYWGYIGIRLGLYWGYIGATLGLYWGYIGVILGLYWG